MYKDFDKWNEIKKSTNSSNRKVYFKERDIFYIKIGENIGFEQSGKGDMFLRPVVVLKKFNNNFFMGVPLTTTIKKSNTILSQMKSFDIKRIKHKIGMISERDFIKLKSKITNLYGNMLASPKGEDDPEGVCK